VSDPDPIGNAVESLTRSGGADGAVLEIGARDAGSDTAACSEAAHLGVGRAVQIIGTAVAGPRRLFTGRVLCRAIFICGAANTCVFTIADFETDGCRSGAVFEGHALHALVFVTDIRFVHTRRRISIRTLDTEPTVANTKGLMETSAAVSAAWCTVQAIKSAVGADALIPFRGQTMFLFQTADAIAIRPRILAQRILIYSDQAVGIPTARLTRSGRKITVCGITQSTLVVVCATFLVIFVNIRVSVCVGIRVCV
jgi:hypothetical protein